MVLGPVTFIERTECMNKRLGMDGLPSAVVTFGAGRSGKLAEMGSGAVFPLSEMVFPIE